MCCSGDAKCSINVTELENGFQIQVIGDQVKESLKPENLKRCLEACCQGKEPFKGLCPH